MNNMKSMEELANANNNINEALVYDDIIQKLTEAKENATRAQAARMIMLYTDIEFTEPKIGLLASFISANNSTASASRSLV